VRLCTAAYTVAPEVTWMQTHALLAYKKAANQTSDSQALPIARPIAASLS
jgi:hypothetical protein